MDLMDEIERFINVSARLKQGYVVAIGAFPIGMEWVIHKISGNFAEKVYMPPAQLKFLKFLKTKNDPDSIIDKLLSKVIEDQNASCIHVLPVEKITYEVRIFKIVLQLLFAFA